MELKPDVDVQPDGREGAEDQAKRAMNAAGALVLQLRREGGYSIAALAAMADLSPGLLSQIERGQGNPSLTTLIKLSQALKVPVGRFFGTPDETGALVRHNARRRLQVAEDNLVYELPDPAHARPAGDAEGPDSGGLGQRGCAVHPPRRGVRHDAAGGARRLCQRDRLQAL